MPMKLNVGGSKKIGEANYGSRGASVNLELEIDPSLANEPAKLHEKIRALFGLVRTSLAEELNSGNGHPVPSNGHGAYHNTSPPNGNGRSNDRQPGVRGQPRAATPSQVKALYAIARSQGLELGELLRERYRIGRPDELSIREASELIDNLKSVEVS